MGSNGRLGNTFGNGKKIARGVLWATITEIGRSLKLAENELQRRTLNLVFSVKTVLSSVYFNSHNFFFVHEINLKAF